MFTEMFETNMSILEISLRLGFALLLGGLIGLEREMKGRPAGLRTNMIVALAAASFMLLGAELISEGEELPGIVNADPLRIIEAVITGVAFLGAGAIIRAGGDVKGLTTGAGLWMAGALGVACGGGYYAIAVIAAALTVVVLHVLYLVERRLDPPEP